MDTVMMTELMREGVWVVIKLCAPMLLLSMLVGVLLAIFQAVTQIHEQTLSFIFKLTVVVIVLLVVIAIRCIQVGLRSGTPLSMLVCFGVAGTILFQTFENAGMCMGITPVIGITLPFISYGGSSIVSLFAAMGIVSGIKYKRKPTRYAYY